MHEICQRLDFVCVYFFSVLQVSWLNVSEVTFSLFPLVFANLAGGCIPTTLLNVSPVGQHAVLCHFIGKIWIT